MTAEVIPMVPTGSAAPLAAPPTATGFGFGPDYETKLAALVLRDERYAREGAMYLKPDFFTNAVERNLVQVALEFVQTYRSAPSPETVFDMLRHEKKVPAAELPVYIDGIAKLMKIDLREREFVRQRAVTFCRQQALLMASIKIPDLVEKGKYDEVRDLVGKAYQIGMNNQASFYELFEQAENRRKTRHELASGKIITGVSTGFHELDKHLYRRGYGKGELTVIMAPSKRGKTAFMIQSGVTAAVAAGKKVLYVTLEVDTDIISDRADACLTSTEMDALITQADDVARGMISLGKAPSTGKFYVERRPANSMTTTDLELLVDTYINAGIVLDMVFVDYIGIMRLLPNDDRFVGLGNATKELRRIAGVYNVAMVTGAQTNRDAVGKQVAGMESIGESFAIVQDCDLLLSLNANDAEMAMGVRRIYLAASRNSPEVTIKVQGDLAKMQMVQKVIEVS